MIAAFLIFWVVGLGFFYLQNLVFFPHVHLRLLALLLFYVGLRPSLALALSLGLALVDHGRAGPHGRIIGDDPGADDGQGHLPFQV